MGVENAGEENKNSPEQGKSDAERGEAPFPSFSSFLGKPIEMCIVCIYPSYDESIVQASTTPVSYSDTSTISLDSSLVS